MTKLTKLGRSDDFGNLGVQLRFTIIPSPTFLTTWTTVNVHQFTCSTDHSNLKPPIQRCQSMKVLSPALSANSRLTNQRPPKALMGSNCGAKNGRIFQDLFLTKIEIDKVYKAGLEWPCGILGVQLCFTTWTQLHQFTRSTNHANLKQPI